jgi:phage/plasmid-like protein (TIGR03299 family)
MAHNIEFNETKGTHSFFNVNEKAWHGLGQVVSGALTSAEAIQQANLDFGIEKLPVRILLPNGETHVSDSQYANVRNDNNEVLGYVGSRYEILQNKDAFNFFDSIVGSGEAIFETAGVLGKGERIFITAKLPDYIKVGKDDLIEQYLFLTNSHNGKDGVTAAFTPIRIVCNNTLNAAMRQCQNKITIRHTVSMHDKLAIAQQLMGITNLYKTQIEEVFNAMANKQVNEKTYRDVIVKSLADSKKQVELYGTEASSTRFDNMVEDVMNYAFAHNTQRMKATEGTLYGVYNALTGFYQNELDWGKKEEKKVEQILDGRVYQKTQKAFDLCLEMLN